MKVLLIEILKFFLRIIYAPIKLFKTKDRIVYLSRQSNDKSLDMRLLEKEIDKQCPNTEQVFRLKMIPESLGGKISYCFLLSVICIILLPLRLQSLILIQLQFLA
ncbi:MAG: hypothetical protein ACLTSM_05525 [Eubacterium sp.]